MPPRPTRSFRESFDALHETAVRETGLSDFGDEAYRKNLEFLLECYDGEAILGDEGREATQRTLVDCLAGRLYSTQRLALHPECRDRPIERPLVIAGLPRTGSNRAPQAARRGPPNRRPWSTGSGASQMFGPLATSGPNTRAIGQPSPRSTGSTRARRSSASPTRCEPPNRTNAACSSCRTS